MNKIDLLKRYVAPQGDRITQILDMGDYYGATNAQVILMIPKTHIPEGINPDDLSKNPPDTSFVFKSIKRQVPFEFELTKLILALSNVPKVQEHDDCQQCDGWGKIECPCCDSETTCKECDGTGEGDPISGQYTYNYEHYLQLDNSYFIVGNIEDLINMLIGLEFKPEQTIKLVASDYLKPHIFEINDIKIVLMPANSEYVDKEKVIKIC